ncbi:MAG: DUF2332 domain-containing protein [Bacillota bacterium]
MHVDPNALAAAFRRFAEVECTRSPLYRAITNGIADDPELIALANEAPNFPKTNLLLAAVQYLLLRGADHALRTFYPSLGGAFAEGDPVFPAFRDFCLTYRAEILPLLRSRLVQTNEVARAAILLPAFSLVAARANQAPLALIEVGTSAGLLLLWDRYAYDYGTGELQGDVTSPVQVSCETRGELRPPIPPVMPAVAMRVGIDLNPIDVRDPDAALWLRSLVWPDQTARAARLAQAIELATAEPPTLVAGDGLEATWSALDQVPEGSAPVVFHCHTLNQFRPEDKERFAALLAAASGGRTLYQVALEYTPGSTWPEVRLQTFCNGALAGTETLGRYQAHGDWIEWSCQKIPHFVY